MELQKKEDGKSFGQNSSIFLSNFYKNDYKLFLQTVVLPLIGITNQKDNLENNIFEALGFFAYENDTFYFGDGKYNIFTLTFKFNGDQNFRDLAKLLIINYFTVSKYGRQGDKKMDYSSEYAVKVAYDYSVQKSISSWISPKNSEFIEDLIGILEQWASKTYEGKRVPFALIIDNDDGDVTKYAIPKEKFTSFLQDEYAAVFSDCISSAFLLSNNGAFKGMVSTFEGDKIVETTLSSQSPFRFSALINREIIGDRVGLFLLVNGDILIIKNKKVQFVKRANKWLNFTFESFYNAIKSKKIMKNLSKPLLETVFCSVIDVSFSHGGGIIAVTDQIKEIAGQINDTKMPVLSEFDDLSNQLLNSFFEEARKDDKKPDRFHIREDELIKRLVKRDMLQSIVPKSRLFSDINRKIRCELIELDGASIVNFSGKIISFGAIIQNDSGSSGGGRGAAAKKLSREALAIKISTDGYIDAYVNGDNVYSIK